MLWCVACVCASAAHYCEHLSTQPEDRDSDGDGDGGKGYCADDAGDDDVETVICSDERQLGNSTRTHAFAVITAVLRRTHALLAV
jgi:hypothetical protein